MKALLLHPSLAVRERFATVLLRRTHGVSAFGDTADAFAAFAHGAFPLVIAGGPDAPGFCRQLRTLSGGANAHVLAIDTADHDSIEALLEAGADNVLAEDAPDALVDRHLGIAEQLLICDAEAMMPGSQAALLQQVADATSEFLGAAPFYEAFHAAVGRIGQAVDVDRVYLFEHHPHPQTGEAAISQRAEWVRDLQLAELDNPAMVDLPYQAAGLERHLEQLQAGRPVEGHEREFSQRERELLEPQGILSMLLNPVFVFGEYWGFVGFDECRAERQWSAADRAALEIVCHAVGRALERERATDELRKSEERFRSLVSEISDIVYRHDLGGVLTEVNEAALEFTGYAREEIIGRDFAEVVHPDSVEPGRQRTQQKVAGETDVTRFEVQVVKKDGSVVPIEVSSRLVYEDGQPVAVQGIGRDVSHRHQYEEALRQAEAQQRALVAALPDFVFRVSGDGTILDYKPGNAARVLTGPQDAIGLNLFVDIDSANAATRRAALQEALRTGEPVQTDFMRLLQGHTRYFESRTVATGDDEAVIYVRETTDRVQIEEALRQSESRQRALVQAFPDFVLRVSRDGTIVDFHPPTGQEDLLPREKAVGRHFSELMYGDERVGQVAGEIDAALKTGELQRTEYESVERGQVSYFERRIVASDEDEVVVFVREVTDRVRAERALREAEARNRSLVRAFPDFVLRIRGDGTILDYHSGPQASIQYDEDMVGRNIADLHVTGSMGYRLDLLRRVIETGEVASEEFRVESRGGTLDLESRVVQSGDDEAVVFFRDVSERRQAEEALRRSEERYRTIVEEAADWIWILDRDDEGGFRLSFVNESYVQATGRSKDEAQGLRIDELGRWRSARPALEHLQMAVDRGEPISYEQYVGTLHGDIRLSVRMTPLFGPEGECDRVIVVAHPVSDDRRAQLLLGRLGRILQASTNEVYVIEAESLRFEDANTSALESLGYSLAELRQMTPREVVVGATDEWIRDLLQPLMEGEVGTVAVDVQHRRRDGSTYVIESQLQLSQEDSQLFVVVIGRDVTELRAHEAAVRESEARFRTIFSATPEAIGIIRLSDARFVDVNDRFEGFSGYRREEVVGLAWQDIGLDAPNPVGRDLVNQLVSEQRAIHTEVSFARKDGEQREAEVTVNLVEISGELCVMAVARDITERKQTEKQIRRLAAIVESSPDAIVIANRAGYIQGWNPAAERLFGYTAEEAVGQHLRFYMPEGDGAGLPERMDQLAQGAMENFETVRIHRDGTPVDVSVTSFGIRDESGHAFAFAASLRDIRETRRAREEINRLAAVVQSTGDAVVTFDLEGQIQSWNPAAEALFGYTADEARKKHVGRFVPEDAADEAMADWDVLKQGGTVPPRDTVRLHRDRTRLDVSLASFPIRDAQGQVTSVASMVRDIRERKHVEQAMARLAAIVESSDDAIYAMDRDRQLVSWNSAAEQLYGYSADEVLGHRARFLVPDSDLLQAQEDADRALAGESPPARETQRIRRDGSLVDVSISVFPVHSTDGTSIGYGAIARDITQQIRARQELLEAQTQLESIATNAPVLLMVWDAAGVCRFAAGQAWRAAGINPSDLPGAHAQSHGAAAAFAHELLRLAQDHPPGATTRFQGRYYQSSHSPLGDDGSIVVVAVDVTDRVLAEEARREAEERMRAVATNSPIALFALDSSGVITFFEGAGLGDELFPGETMVGQDATAFSPQVARLDEAVERALRGERFDTVLWFGDQALETHYSPSFDASGAFAGVTGITIDVTDRMQAEEARREAEALVRNVAAAAPLALWALDGEGTFTLLEGRVLETAHIDRDRLLGKNIYDMEHSIPQLASNAARALAGEFFTHTVWMNGRALEAHHQPVLDENGQVAGCIGVTVDVTERVLADEQRRQAEQRLRTFVENAPILIFAVDSDGTYIFREGRDLERRGETSQTLLGENIFEVYRDHPDVPANVRRAMAGEQFATVFFVNNEYREVHYAPLRDEVGQVTGVLGVSVDVTDRVRAEEARERAEEHLHTVTAAAPVVLFSLDAQGRLIFAEGAIASRISELTGLHRNIDVPAHFADRPDIAGSFRQALEGETVNTTFEVGDATLEVRLRPIIEDGGEPAGIVGVVTEITDRIRAEEAVLQAQKLESLAVLAGGIAHDFNNLLVGILGNAGLAMSELPEASPARETITDIETAARRAADLARQMLAYSGRGQFVVQQFNLSSLVREMDSLLCTYTHRAVMHYALAEDLPPVEADGTQIRQVVMNLVINAADAIGDADGAINIRTGRMYADADYLASTYLPEDQHPGEYVYLEVSDSGDGMPPETLARIFDPFFTTKFTGKGLGLAAVLGIVRGHKGAIRVESAAGEGTTFRLLLPAASTQAPAAAQEADTAPWRGSGTVLLADDEAPVRKVAARALRSFGFKVIEAEHGIEALEAFDEHGEPVVAALVDVTMPRMNGDQLFDALRERKPHLPVVFMSGYSEDGHASGTREACVTFVQKPFDLITLRGALQRVLTPGSE